MKSVENPQGFIAQIESRLALGFKSIFVSAFLGLVLIITTSCTEKGSTSGSVETEGKKSRNCLYGNCFYF